MALLPVVGGGLVHNKLVKLPDTLLGFETTGPCPFFLGGGIRLRVSACCCLTLVVGCGV